MSEKQTFQLGLSSHGATGVAGKVSPITAGVILCYSTRGKLLPNGPLSPLLNFPLRYDEYNPKDSC